MKIIKPHQQESAECMKISKSKKKMSEYKDITMGSNSSAVLWHLIDGWTFLMKNI